MATWPPSFQHPQGFFRLETSCLLTWKQLQECDWQGFPKMCALQNYVKSTLVFRSRWSKHDWIFLKRRASQARKRKKRCDAIRWIRHPTTGWLWVFDPTPSGLLRVYFFGGGMKYSTGPQLHEDLGILRNPFVKFQNHQNLNQSLWN